MISALTDHRLGATKFPNYDIPALATRTGPDA